MTIDFQRLFQALPSPFMVIDRNLVYVEANDAYQRAVMLDRGRLIGRYLFEAFPNEDESGRRLRASFARVFETGEPDTLAYIPYDIPRPEEHGGGMEQRFWTAVHTPIQGPDGRVAYIVQNTVDVTDIVKLRAVASQPFSVLGETRLLERAREAEQQHQALIEESEDFRRLFQQAPSFIAVLSGPEHVFTFANEAYARLVGGRPVIGLTVADALPEVVDQGFIDLLDRVYATGKGYVGEASLIQLQHSADEPPVDAYLDFNYDAIRGRDGSIIGVFVQGNDRTETVRDQQRQKLLVDELNHRVKNTLATVQSIASQTLRSARDLNSARVDFEGRIRALSDAHNLLSDEKWAQASLIDLVTQEFSVAQAPRVRIGGPEVRVAPKASIALAMVVHELASNAAKYGSLSSEGGTVTLGWHTDIEGALVIEWREAGGPPVAPPERRGFGSRMVERVIAGELGGTFEPHYDPAGFRARIVICSDVLMPAEEDANG